MSAENTRVSAGNTESHTVKPEKSSKKKVGGRSPKRKGSNFERDLVKLAKESGLEAERSYASNGRALGHGEEVDVLIGGKRVQAKIRKAIPAYLVPSEQVDSVAFRCDRGEPMVMLTLWEWFDLIKAVDKGASDES